MSGDHRTNWKSSCARDWLLKSLSNSRGLFIFIFADLTKRIQKLKNAEQLWATYGCGSFGWRRAVAGSIIMWESCKSRKRWSRWPDRGFAMRRDWSIQPLFLIQLKGRQDAAKNYLVLWNKFACWRNTAVKKVSFTGPKEKTNDHSAR